MATLVLTVLFALVGVHSAQGQNYESERGFRLILHGESKTPMKIGLPYLATAAVIKYRFLSGKSPSVQDWLSKSSCENLQPIKDAETLKMFKEEFVVAAAEWSKVANITFVYVDLDEHADVLVGFQGEPTGTAFVNLKVRQNEEGIHTITKGIVCLNPRKRWVNTPGIPETYSSAYVFAHELGHILGFDHPWGQRSQGSLMLTAYPEARNSLTPFLSKSDAEGAQYLYGQR